MKTIESRSRAALAALVLFGGCASVAAAAEIRVYKQPNFAGGELTLDRAAPNLAKHGFLDQASSLVVSGAWEVCTQPEYRGDCVTVGPGRYATLDARLNHRIESVRPAARAGGDRGESRVTLYGKQGFAGAEVSLDSAAGNLERHGMQNQASSLVVSGGAWEFCSQPNFDGDCMVLAPGKYATLDPRINHRMESARPVAGARLAAREPRAEAPRESRRQSRREGQRNERGAVDLYPDPGFGGRPMRLEADADTLDGSRMQERVSSLVVHDGAWQVCTRPGYEGRCRVYEPGEYATLDRMGDRVASLRQVR